MVSEISVLKFYKMPTNGEFILSSCSSVSCMVESSGRRTKNTLARALLRDSKLIGLCRPEHGAPKKPLQVNQMEDHWQWEVPRLKKSQESEVQAPSSTTNTWKVLDIHFLSFIFTPADCFLKQRLFNLWPTDGLCEVCELILNCKQFGVCFFVCFVFFLTLFLVYNLTPESSSYFCKDP